MSKIFDLTNCGICPICNNNNKHLSYIPVVICSNENHSSYTKEIMIYKDGYCFQYIRINNKFILEFYKFFEKEDFNIVFNEDMTINDLYLIIDKYFKNLAFK